MNFGPHADFIFASYALTMFVVAVLIANRVSNDGESNWLEGIQLLAVYLIIAVSFFVLS